MYSSSGPSEGEAHVRYVVYSSVCSVWKSGKKCTIIVRNLIKSSPFLTTFSTASATEQEETMENYQLVLSGLDAIGLDSPYSQSRQKILEHVVLSALTSLQGT